MTKKHDVSLPGGGWWEWAGWRWKKQHVRDMEEQESQGGQCWGSSETETRLYVLQGQGSGIYLEDWKATEGF